MRNGIPARFWLWRLRCIRPASASASAVRKTWCWWIWPRSWEASSASSRSIRDGCTRKPIRFLDQVREKYQIPIEVFFPRPEAVEKLVKEKGLFSFYKDGHQECCGVRKVEPLRRALSTHERLGYRPAPRPEPLHPHLRSRRASRSHLLHPHNDLVKFNPLANWSSKQVWDYIRENDVPYNSLHERGFVSIGCEPCTKAVLPGQHEREGRWWWEEATKKECGLHSGNKLLKAVTSEE